MTTSMHEWYLIIFIFYVCSRITQNLQHEIGRGFHNCVPKSRHNLSFILIIIRLEAELLLRKQLVAVDYSKIAAKSLMHIIHECNRGA